MGLENGEFLAIFILIFFNFYFKMFLEVSLDGSFGCQTVMESKRSV